MSIDLVLNSSCSRCGSTTDLYGSNCKHMTLCLQCGKTMVESLAKCHDCGATVTRLIREYNVRATPNDDKNYFLGKFATGLPTFSKKKNAENKWSLHKEGLHGRQVNDALREKYKNRPWLLEDGTGQFQYEGHMEGSQQAAYYLLILQGKEFNAIPAGSWYNFKKVAQYKQLTLEEAEEKTKNRKKTADGYQRWMMKAANNGPAAFGGVEKFGEKENGTGGGRGCKKATWDDEGGNVSDRGDEDEEEEAARKNRLGMNKRSGDDDDEEGQREGDSDTDMDDDDDDIEKGDDWEHEETFTDDDEALSNPEEQDDWAHEVPAPPEIKQDEEDEDEENGEGGLSKSGKELKELLRRLNDSDDDEEDLSPKQKGAVKDEPADSSPAKPMTSGSSKVTSPSKSAKGKRKLNGDNSKTPNGAPQKKVKQLKPTVKEENVAAAASSATPNGQPSTSPVIAEEIRAVLSQKGPMITQDLVAVFKSRLKTPEDKKAFAEIMKTISKIQKIGGSNYIVLRNK